MMLKSRKRMRTALFGGTGFVGRHLVSALFNQGCKVVIVSRHPQRHKHLLVLPGIDIVEGDIHDTDSLASLVRGADAVFNLIGILHDGRGRSTFEKVHADFPENLAAACLEQGVGRLIHISAIGTSVNAPSEYLKSKGRGEDAVVAAMDQGLDATVFRPSIIFGPNGGITQMFEQMLRLSIGVFPVICPNALMQPVHVVDVASCIAQCLSEPQTIGNCYDLAGPEILTLYEIVSIINELSGSRRKLIKVAEPVSRLMAAIMQYLPGKPLSPDNVASMQVPSVSDMPFPDYYASPLRGMRQTADCWLTARENRYNALRAHSGR